MGLSPQAFSPTHGSTMLHSLVYIKIWMNKIYSENPKNLNQSFNTFQMSFRKTDQNGGAYGKN